MGTPMTYGGRAVVAAKDRAESNTGLEYNRDYCLVFELADGKIQHVGQSLDSGLVTRVVGSA